jgi:hypothetical protein
MPVLPGNLGRLGPQGFPPTSMPPGRPVTVGSPVQGFIVGGFGGGGGSFGRPGNLKAIYHSLLLGVMPQHNRKAFSKQ